MIKKKLASAIRIYSAMGMVGLWRAVGRQFGYVPLTKSNIDEVDIVIQALRIRDCRGTMVDVGGHFGHTALPFCKAGWRVLAFEPDSLNRDKLTETIGAFPNASIDKRALSNEEKESVTFYRSAQSTGISGLSAFHSSHQAADTVPMTTLTKALAEHGIDQVDFLKIDTEGFDKFVLEGLPWERISPRVIVCEFEDAKTLPLGYDFKAFASYLADRGYSIMVSEWHPIIQYGGMHNWADFKVWPCALNSSKAWGNFIAAREPEVFAAVQHICIDIKRKFR